MSDNPDFIPLATEEDIERMANELVAIARAFGRKYVFLPNGTWITREEAKRRKALRPRRIRLKTRDVYPRCRKLSH
ncbi:MAG: hypothetical protein V1848_00225 [Candidatus Magasanikbacteria bacterium]